MPLRGYPQYGPWIHEYGEDIDSSTPHITSPLHHVITSTILTTLHPPQAMLGFIGPVYLVASSVFDWDATGNIATANATSVCIGTSYAFVYSPKTAKWHPVDSAGCVYRGGPPA